MNVITTAAMATSLVFAGSAMAQNTPPLSAKASNPVTMGWMQGFPPPADKMIRFTDPDYFAFPKLRWTVCHFRQLGQMMLDEGRVGDEQVVPREAVTRISKGGDPATFAKAGYDLLPGWSYGGMWWVSNDDHGAYAARGVHGQTVWIDPTADMVIVRFASNPVAANAGSDPTSLPAYRAVADYLMGKDPAKR